MNNLRTPLYLLICCLFYNITCAQQQLNYYDTIPVGGIKQVIAVNGKQDAPVLLFLHGGPGASRIPQMEKVSGLLREKFCVVMWDQRETGLTLKLNTSPVPDNKQALSELNTVRIPFQTSDDLYYERKWMNTLSGRPFPDKDTSWIKDYLKVWCDTWLKPWNEAIVNYQVTGYYKV